MLYTFLAFLLINGWYNYPQKGLRGFPPFELFCQAGYLLIVPLSIYINDLDPLPWQTYIYLFLFAIQSHLIGEVMDIEPDQEAGRKTTATVLGIYRTKLLIIAVVTAEVLLLVVTFKEYIFGGMLAFGLIWLLIDLFYLFKTKSYTLQQMKLLAKSSNVIAILSILYVWYSGCLLTVP